MVDTEARNARGGVLRQRDWPSGDLQEPGKDAYAGQEQKACGDLTNTRPQQKMEAKTEKKTLC